LPFLVTLGPTLEIEAHCRVESRRGVALHYKLKIVVACFQQFIAF
jgi:hypothetical protein